MLNEVSVTEQFSGPIPHPSILRDYDQITPGIGDRIVAMAEKEQAHRIECEKVSLSSDIDQRKAENIEARIGQFLGFGIGITAILSGTYTIINGFPVAGAFIGAGGVIGLVSVFIYGRSKVVKPPAE